MQALCQFDEVKDELRRLQAKLTANFNHMDGILERWNRSMGRYFIL